MSVSFPQDWLTAHEAAACRGVSVSWVKKHAAALQRQRGVKHGRLQWLYHPDSLRSRYEVLVATWLDALAQGLHRDHAKPLSAKTLANYRYGLTAFWGLVPIQPRIEWLTAETLKVALSMIPVEDDKGTDHYGKRRSIWTAVLMFYQWLAMAGHVDGDELRGIKGLKPRRKHLAKQPVLYEDDMQRIITVGRLDRPPRHRTAAVTKALFYTLMLAGLRCNEACRLRLEDVRLDEGIIVVRFGKGSKERKIPVAPALEVALREYMHFRVRAKRACEAFFISRLGQGFDPRRVAKRMRTLTAKAGVYGPPHSMRRFCANYWVAKGLTVPEIRDLLGHASIQTTNLYLIPDWRRVRRVMQEANAHSIAA